MAIFDKPNQQTDYASNITTIAAGTKLEGKVNIECALHIDGDFSGEIKSTSTITIGESGRLNGSLVAEKLIISGCFQGDAVCEGIELMSGGDVEAVLTSSSLTIENESRFQGQSIMKKPGEGAALIDLKRESNPDSINEML